MPSQLADSTAGFPSMLTTGQRLTSIEFKGLDPEPATRRSGSALNGAKGQARYAFIDDCR
jgi:hypothetical protein